MSTPTPRTDAVYLEHRYWANEDEATEAIEDLRDLARKLERELATEREKSERYRLATLKLDAELATERARLDWLQAQEVKRGFECGITADDPSFLVLGEDGTTHWGNTYREAIDAAMKEGAK